MKNVNQIIIINVTGLNVEGVKYEIYDNICNFKENQWLCIAYLLKLREILE